MSIDAVLALLTAVCSFIAAIFVVDQYIHRPKAYKLFWLLGLVAYGIASTAEVIGAAQGHWSLGVYRTWYFFGGLLVAAYLGMGTAYLLLPRKVANVIMALLVLGTLYGVVRVFTAPISAANLTLLHNSSSQQVVDVSNFTIMPLDIEILAPIMNITGAAFLFGGAIWSAWVFWRKHIMPFRVVSNVLIAIGALAPSILTGLIRLGFTSGFFLGQLIGVVFILAGFLVSIEIFAIFRVPFTNVVLHQRAPVQTKG
ncbi:MAG TPA: hypothetical protein VF099_07245 [Ktedonobacterales bacterium]